MITAQTQLCIVAGDPVAHSLSPQLHNAGYAATGLASQFVYMAAQVRAEDIAQFANALRALHIRGASLTMPHKEIIQPFLDEIDPVAQRIGAVNTVVQQHGKLHGYNTDWLGVVRPLQALLPLRGKRAVVLGAGGAARAMVYGLLHEGAPVTICNRTVAKATVLAKQFGCQAAGLDAHQLIADADIICNATAVGMEQAQSPVSAHLLHAGQVVLDAVYAPLHTQLLRDAMAAGVQTVLGTEMLLHQAAAQFELFTGKAAPLDAMRQVLPREAADA